MKIYIAGKITGEAIEDCYIKFHHAEMSLMGKYENVVNPLKLEGIYFGIEHAEALYICLKALKECDVIFMLKDWSTSVGAIIEHGYALEWGLNIIYQ